jgi:hypothetical protein
MPKCNCKEEALMFSDEVLEKIFARKELQSLPLQVQSSIIHAIENVLEEDSKNADKQSVSATGNEL